MAAADARSYWGRDADVLDIRARAVNLGLSCRVVRVPVPPPARGLGRGRIPARDGEAAVGGVTDGVVEAVFGVMLTDHHYEAHRGLAEFRGGKLVRLQIGRFPAWRDYAGLTVGFALLPTVTGPFPDGGELIPRAAVTRVYDRGTLDTADDHDAVFVNTDRL